MKGNDRGIVDAICYASKGVSPIYDARANQAMNYARQLGKYKDRLAEAIVQKEKNHEKVDKRLKKMFTDVCTAHNAAMNEYEDMHNISETMTNKPHIPFTQKGKERELLRLLNVKAKRGMLTTKDEENARKYLSGVLEEIEQREQEKRENNINELYKRDRRIMKSRGVDISSMPIGASGFLAYSQTEEPIGQEEPGEQNGDEEEDVVERTDDDPRPKSLRNPDKYVNVEGNNGRRNKYLATLMACSLMLAAFGGWLLKKDEHAPSYDYSATDHDGLWWVDHVALHNSDLIPDKYTDCHGQDDIDYAHLEISSEGDAKIVYYKNGTAVDEQKFDKEFGERISAEIQHYNELMSKANYHSVVLDKNTLSEVLQKDPDVLKQLLPDGADSVQDLMNKLNESDAMRLLIPDNGVPAYLAFLDSDGEIIGDVSQLLTQEDAEYLEKLAEGGA